MAESFWPSGNDQTIICTDLNIKEFCKLWRSPFIHEYEDGLEIEIAYLKSDNSGAVLSRYYSPVTLVPAANEFPETSFTILCTIAVPS